MAKPVVAPKIETPKGMSYRDNWTAEVFDINSVPREYLIANMTMLNNFAKYTKGSIPIPGVKFNCEKIAAGRF